MIAEFTFAMVKSVKQVALHLASGRGGTTNVFLNQSKKAIIIEGDLISMSQHSPTRGTDRKVTLKF